MRAARLPRLWCALQGVLPLEGAATGASGLAERTSGRDGRLVSLWEIKVPIAPENVSRTDEVLLEQGDARWSVVENVIDRHANVVGIFASEQEARQAWELLKPLLENDEAVAEAPEVRPVADEDWRNSYKAHFKAWHFGRLHWVPVWERESFRLPEGDAVLWLDPGLAFGTGNHETTRLCVERLVKLAERGLHARVVDAGCGSGILALSAALLGFRHVSGFDNDAEAVRVSEENAALNGLSDRVRFSVGDLVSGLSKNCGDIVIANIQADVLMRFRHELVQSVSAGGTLVLSGILAQEQAQVMASFQEVAANWPIDGRVLGEWSDVVLTRPSAS